VEGGKCDVIFRYIYTNTTKLILYLSYLVRLDCFSNVFIWWVIASNSYFGRNMYINGLFLLKNCKKKSPKAGGFDPRPTLPSAARGSAQRPPIPQWEFMPTSLLHTILLMLNIKHENCEYQITFKRGVFSLFTWSKQKWLFWRASFYPANQSNLKSIQKALISWKKAGPLKKHFCFDHVNRQIKP